MIFVKFAIFILLINLSMTLVTAAQIPLQCTAFGSCEYWEGAGSNVWESEIRSEVDDGTYETTPIESGVDQPLEIFNVVSRTLALLTNLVIGTLDGGYSMTQFFLCGGTCNINACGTVTAASTDECRWGNMSLQLASAIRIIMYAVYVLALIQIVRGYNVEK